MVRLLASADWHLGLTRYGTPGPDGLGSRVRDFELTLGRFVATAIREEVDLAVFAGDTFNTRREGPHERAAFAAAIATLRDDDVTVLIVPGNHDGRSTVGTSESDSLLWLETLQMEGVHVFLDPVAGTVPTRVGEIRFVAMPYPHRRMLDAEMPEVAPSDRVLLAGGRIERKITEMVESLDDAAADVPLLFVGHLTVADSIAGSETAMQMGWDVAIHRRVLEPFDLAILGHIHKQQRLGRTNAWYTGSPEYIDFTEAGLDKGWLLAGFERGGEPVIESIPTGARPMINLGAVQNADGSIDVNAVIGQHAPGVWAHGPMVRVELRAAARPDPAEVAKLQRALMDHGASFVKTEVRLPERAPVDRRAAEPDPELDLMDATRRYLTASGFANVDAAMEAARVLVAATTGN